jgi:cytosine deaminase
MEITALDQEFIEEAYQEALKGYQQHGIPIGSVLVHNGKIIGRGHNQRMQKGSVVLHGEMDALENAGRLPASVYRECTLYTTLSPCPMCTGAILLYQISRVIIGENKTFMGDEKLLESRNVKTMVLQDHRCIEMMEQFILEKPTLWNEDIGV